jgi:hypothetical protein
MNCLTRGVRPGGVGKGKRTGVLHSWISFGACSSVSLDPLKGSGSLIVGFDVAHELAAQVGNEFEDSTGNNVTLDFREPVFDLVEPGTISGRVMQRHVGMVDKEAIHELGFVGGEVVHDEVDFLAGGLWRLAVLAMTWPLLVSRAA